MTVLEIANDLVRLCKLGQNFVAMETHYADDIVSVEAMAPPGASPEFVGKPAVIAKSTGWGAAHEIHSGNVEGPFVHGDRFIVRFTFDVTVKASGVRMIMDEVGLYSVTGEKIVREEFFYAHA